MSLTTRTGIWIGPGSVNEAEIVSISTSEKKAAGTYIYDFGFVIHDARSHFTFQLLSSLNLILYHLRARPISDGDDNLRRLTIMKSIMSNRSCQIDHVKSRTWCSGIKGQSKRQLHRVKRVGRNWPKLAGHSFLFSADSQSMLAIKNTNSIWHSRDINTDPNITSMPSKIADKLSMLSNTISDRINAVCASFAFQFNLIFIIN